MGRLSSRPVNRRAFLAASASATAVGAVAGHLSTAIPAAAAVAQQREDGAYAGSGRGQSTVLWSVATDTKVAALTFDDGPTPMFTPTILDVLADHHVKATFFVIGAAANLNPDILARTVAEGHEVGNHTYGHHSAALLSDAAIADDVRRGATIVAEATGHPARWYRPPRGMLTGASLRYAHVTGADVAMWSVDRGPAGDDDDQGVLDHLVSSMHPGAIVDLHDGVGASGIGPQSLYKGSLVTRRQAEVAALPRFIEVALAAGYRFVTLTELAGRPTSAADSSA